LRLFSGIMTDLPTAAGQMLIALDFYLGPVTEAVVVGDLRDEGVRHALRLLQEGFRPHQVVAHRPADPAAAELAEKTVPLLAGRSPAGTVTTYLCRNLSCQAPIVGVEGLKQALVSGQ